jgi:hypothetical protein
MKLQRRFTKLNRGSKMRKLLFPVEHYEVEVINTERVKQKIDEKEKEALVFQDGAIGLFELIWLGINISEKKLNKKEHKIVKRLKSDLRFISRFKDVDEDSRVLNDGGPHELLIEEDQYSILKEILEDLKFKAAVSDEVADMWEFIDNAPEHKKMEIVKDDTAISK